MLFNFTRVHNLKNYLRLYFMSHCPMTSGLKSGSTPNAEFCSKAACLARLNKPIHERNKSVQDFCSGNKNETNVKCNMGMGIMGNRESGETACCGMEWITTVLSNDGWCDDGKCVGYSALISCDFVSCGSW